MAREPEYPELDEMDRMHAAEVLAVIKRCVADEREACAQACETLGITWRDWADATASCAARIRARGTL